MSAGSSTRTRRSRVHRRSLDGIVYFATLNTHIALNALTGKQVWTYPDGEYLLIVADKQRVYLIGHALGSTARPAA